MTTTTPGKLLSDARKTKSLTQEDIAKQLRLSVQVIHDLEQDDYARLGVRAFVRGYLCTYARLVGVSETLIFQAFDASCAMPVVSNYSTAIEGAPVMNVTYQQSHSRVHYSRWIMISVIALVFIFFISWLNDYNDASDKNTSAKNTTSSLAFSKQANIPVAPVVLSQPVVASTASVIKKNKVKSKHKKEASNGFVIRPATALHTTYKITPAS